MDIHLPDDLTHRLEQYAIGTGQDVSAVVREAIETRLTIAEQSSKNLDGWTEDALRAEIQQGLDDLANGHYTEHDDTTLADLFEDIKTRGRAQRDALKQRGH
jgi:predicted transcriptional regulator